MLERFAAAGHPAVSFDAPGHGARGSGDRREFARHVLAAFRRRMWPLLGRTTLEALRVLDWLGGEVGRERRLPRRRLLDGRRRRRRARRDRPAGPPGRRDRLDPGLVAPGDARAPGPRAPRRSGRGRRLRRAGSPTSSTRCATSTATAASSRSTSSSAPRTATSRWPTRAPSPTPSPPSIRRPPRGRDQRPSGPRPRRRQRPGGQGRRLRVPRRPGLKSGGRESNPRH